jgi:Putative Flp pilus-assembly TadE/G-like
VASLRPSGSRGPSESSRTRHSGDDGVILVFWALCLPLLAALFVGVLELGNLVQSGDNAQDAADAAALGAAGSLIDFPPPMVVSNIPGILGYMCTVGSGDTISGCAGQNYGWLYGYSIYEGGTWEPIWDPQEAISALRAAGTDWTCQGEARLSRRGHHRGKLYCTGVNIFPPAPGYGVTGSVSPDATISQALAATSTAMSIETNYGVTSYSGCTPPDGFFLADGSSGVSCIGYDAAGTIWVSVPNSAAFPGIGLAAEGKSAWATVSSGTAVLCPGPPPSGVCN